MTTIQDVRSAIEARLAAFLFKSLLKGVGAGKKWGADRAGDRDGGVLDAMRVELPGLALHPLTEEPCLVLGVGPNRVLLPLSSARFRPDTAPGDAVLYALVRDPAGRPQLQLLAKDGKVLINAGSNADVVVNGGSLKVARDTDPVKPTAAMKRVLANLIAFANGIAPGTVAPQDAVDTQLQVGAVNGGADHFKG